MNKDKHGHSCNKGTTIIYWANSCYSISAIAWKKVIRVASYVTFYPCSKKIQQSRTKVFKFVKT